MNTLLAEAEALERRASGERVDYFSDLLGQQHAPAQSLLDVGCGNGYSVARWRANGVRAFGVDRSLYRMGRWVSEHGRRPRMAVADAAQLPFAAQTFDVVVSSGMIEHVGVSESSNPYCVRPLPGRDELREQVVGELGRVTKSAGVALVDCPNGSFPIDFWHGDRIGSFRLHSFPDALLASHQQLLRWGRAAGLAASLQPLKTRLRFRQIRTRWWGQLLSPLAEWTLRVMDRLIQTRFGPSLAWLYPYVVVSYRKPLSE